MEAVEDAIASDPRLNNAGAAKYIGVKPGTLNQWRTMGKGPVFLRVGRFVRYRLSALDAWLDKQQVDPAKV